MHDRLPPKGMCSGSRDLFKFWEISDNKHRDIVAMELDISLLLLYTYIKDRILLLVAC